MLVKVEMLPEVERCHVHLDWETDHKAEHQGTAGGLFSLKGAGKCSHGKLAVACELREICLTVSGCGRRDAQPADGAGHGESDAAVSLRVLACVAGRVYSRGYLWS